MLKYLLKVTVHHPGRYLSDKLVSKFNLKVEFDEERVKKDEDPIFEVTSSAEAMTIPLAYIALNVKSYEIEWIDKSEYCENWLTISHLDLGEKGLKLEMITMDTETSVFVGLPVPIVGFILSGGYLFSMIGARFPSTFFIHLSFIDITKYFHINGLLIIKT